MDKMHGKWSAAGVPVNRRTGRRGVLRLAVTGGAAIAGAALLRGGAARAQPGPGVEPDAGSWKTWVLAGGSQLRLPAPDVATGRTELEEVRLQAVRRDAAVLDRISFWDAGAPGYRWNEAALAALPSAPAVDGGRCLALLNVAIYDATIAAWDSKYAHNRPPPAAADPSLATALQTPRWPSYPSAHAAVAAAAATVLGYLFPDSAETFGRMAEEAGQSRVAAGVNYPSDVSAGLELGRRVGAMVADLGRADDARIPQTRTLPAGPDLWSTAGYPQGVNPVQLTAGYRQTWLIGSPEQVRPAPPPATGSEQRAAELAEVKNFARTVATNDAAWFWRSFAFIRWMPILHQKLFEYGLDANPPRAARVTALATVAAYDAIVACFDAKYLYLTRRPFQMDPSITTVFPTPPHPSYPAAHGTEDGAYATVLAHLFPREAAYFAGRAEEAANSRLWAGIHFRSDLDAGLGIGTAVGRLAVERARTDGAS